MSNQEPAFPRDHAADGHNGMDLRDYAAIKAMQAMLARHFARYGHENYWRRDAIAEEAYDMAEAMMAEKAKRTLSEQQPDSRAASGAGVIDEADKRARDKASMPETCPTATGCREHGCHGACMPPNARANLPATRAQQE